MRALEIGSLMKTLVSGMPVGESLRGNIFPCVAPDKTPYPFAVYKRTGVEYTGDKDTYYPYGSVSVELIVAGSSYSQALDIASAIVDGMPDHPIETDGFEISEIILTNAVEDFQDDAYIQSLTFNIVIDN